MIVRVAVAVIPFDVAVISTAFVELTADVLIVKVAEVLPAGIVTVVGAFAEDLLLETEITSPLVGAMEPMVIVPTEFLPPASEAGFRVSDLIAGGSIVNVAV